MSKFKFGNYTINSKIEINIDIDENGNVKADRMDSELMQRVRAGIKKGSQTVKDFLGGFNRGDVARDMTEENLPVGATVTYYANRGDTIRAAAYSRGMILKVKPIADGEFEVTRKS